MGGAVRLSWWRLAERVLQHGDNRIKCSRKSRELVEFSDDLSGQASDFSESDSSEDEKKYLIPRHRLRPKQLGVKSWKPSNHVFRSVYKYRAYRLMYMDYIIDRKEARKTQKRTGHLEATIKHHEFNGDEPITIIGFLPRLKRNCDRNGMSRGSAFLALP